MAQASPFVATLPDDFFPHLAGVHAYLKKLCDAARAADAELAEEAVRLGTDAAPRVVRALDLAAATLARLRGHLDTCCQAAEDLGRLRGLLVANGGSPARAAHADQDAS